MEHLRIESVIVINFYNVHKNKQKCYFKAGKKWSTTNKVMYLISRICLAHFYMSFFEWDKRDKKGITGNKSL